ncbi:hypothetical protein AB0C52_09845 [Streptomyces sp. NPDC048717]
MSSVRPTWCHFTSTVPGSTAKASQESSAGVAGCTWWTGEPSL